MGTNDKFSTNIPKGNNKVVQMDKRLWHATFKRIEENLSGQIIYKQKPKSFNIEVNLNDQ